AGPGDAVHRRVVERCGDVDQRERREDVDLADVRPGEAGLVRQRTDDPAGQHAVVVPDREAVAGPDRVAADAAPAGLATGPVAAPGTLARALGAGLARLVAG